MSVVDVAELASRSGFVRDSSKKQGNPGGDRSGEDPGGRVGRADGYMDHTGTIDFQALERELQAALAADEKYRRENAAKLQAVEQRVPSYEEFRGIVLASHLKPLERKDKMGGKRSVPWNCHTIHGRTFPEVTTEISQEEIISQPTTSAEFYRNWRRHWRSDPERYQALLQLGGPELGRLFQVDVGFGLLGELLATLAAEVRLADRTAVLGILHSLASTGRFALNLSLLSPAERESCRGLFQKLQAMGAARTLEEERCSQQEQGSEEVSARLLQDLRAMYGVD